MKKCLQLIALASLVLMNNAFALFIPGVGEFVEVITAEQISKRAEELGSQIDQDYSDCQDPIIFICTLNGALFFTADLMKNVKHSSILETIRVSSYHGGLETSGTVKLKYDSLEGKSLEGKHVIVTEDIVDTGLTLQFIHSYLQSKNPASIRYASLVVKKDCQGANTPETTYVGFERSKEFLIGCGLDYQEEYRNLPGVWALETPIAND